MTLSKDLLPFQEPVDTTRVNTWSCLGGVQKTDIMKSLRDANTIDEAKNIVIESNNKSLNDFFVLCLKDIDNMGNTIQLQRLSIDSTTKFKCDLFDVVSVLLSK